MYNKKNTLIVTSYECEWACKKVQCLQLHGKQRENRPRYGSFLDKTCQKWRNYAVGVSFLEKK